MMDAKPWWTSRAVWGAVVTVLASLAGIAGYEFDQESATTLLVSLVTLVSGALSWYGTVRRKTQINPTLVAPGVRLPTKRMRDESVPTDRDEHESYWSDDTRGPLDDH